MLLKKESDILEAMNKELEGAPDSSLKWLADSFGVPFRIRKIRERITKIRKISKLEQRIKELEKKFKRKNKVKPKAKIRSLS